GGGQGVAHGSPKPVRSGVVPGFGTTNDQRGGEEARAMRTVGAPDRKSLAKIAEVPPESVQPWAIVLAGGTAVRLRPLTRMLSGDERPLQYVRLVGPRSLLRQALDRLVVAFPSQPDVGWVT